MGLLLAVRMRQFPSENSITARALSAPRSSRFGLKLPQNSQATRHFRASIALGATDADEEKCYRYVDCCCPLPVRMMNSRRHNSFTGVREERRQHNGAGICEGYARRKPLRLMEFHSWPGIRHSRTCSLTSLLQSQARQAWHISQRINRAVKLR